MTSIFKCRLLYTEKGFVENCLLVEEGGIVQLITEEKNNFHCYDNAKIYELDGVVIPSLVNAHTHLELTDRSENKSEKGKKELWDWIVEIVKYKRSLTDNDYVQHISVGENLLYKTGTSIIGDVRSVLPNMLCLNKLKGIIFFEVLGYIDDLFNQKFELLKQFAQYCKHYSGIATGLSIHSLYTTPFSKAKELVKFAREKRMPIMMHLAETIFENNLFFNGDDAGFHKIFSEVDFESENFKTYSQIIDFLDFNSDTFLVHCVNFTKNDWHKVKERGINVVLCPKSNLFWGEKLPDFNELISLNINFLLGTDSSETNENMDVLKEARFMYNNVNQRDGALKILDAITYKGRKLLNCCSVGIEKGNKCSFLFFPIRCTPLNAAEHILTEQIAPFVYQKEYKDEAFELFKK